MDELKSCGNCGTANAVCGECHEESLWTKLSLHQGKATEDVEDKLKAALDLVGRMRERIKAEECRESDYWCRDCASKEECEADRALLAEADKMRKGKG